MIPCLLLIVSFFNVAHVGRYLFDKCIKGSMKNKTRILVTHQLHFLPEVDYVIVLKDGQVAESGTYSDLIASKGEFADLMRDYGGVDEKAESPKGEEKELLALANVPDSEAVARIEKLLQVKSSKDARELMNVEERAVGSVKGSVWLQYMHANGGWSYLTSLLLLLALTQVGRIGTDYWLVIWTNNSVPSFTQGEYVGVYVAWGVGQAIIFYSISAFFAVTGTRAAKFLHSIALKRIMRAPVSFFDTTPLGRIMNRFSKDQDGVDNTIMDSIRMFAMTLSTCVAIFVLIIFATPWFAVPLFPVLMLYYYVQYVYRSTSRELKRLDAISRSPMYSHITESLNGLATIRAYAEENRFLNKSASIIDANNGPYFVLTVAGRWLALRLEALGASLVFFASLFGVLARNTPGFSPALFGISLSYALQVTGTLNWCVRQFTETEIAMNAVERLVHYGYDVEQEAPSLLEYRPPADWPSKGSIEFKNLDFKYAPDLPLVLKGVSFSVGNNEKVGVVGRTGSGKSSLMQALFRMVEPVGGAIIIDGEVTAKLGLKDLRSGISIIPQDPVLFSGDFRRNLDPFHEHTDADVWDALSRANIKQKVVEAGGLDGAVSEGGENLSVGQRQLICLARAMLKKPKILIMDEATANVDFETDAIIQKCLRTDLGQSTVLTIAHRLVN